MNLDDLDHFKSLDLHDFLGQVDALPDQVTAAWALGQSLQLPGDFRGRSQIVIAGMGDAAVGGELARTLALPECPVPITVWREFDLPACVGPNTLVIALSHSGNTVETLNLAEAALARGAKVLAVTTGGKLAILAEAEKAALWRYTHYGDARGAVSYLFLLPLAALVKLGFLADKSADVIEAVAALKAQQDRLRADSPVNRNPAKRMAGQIMDRIPALFAADYLVPVARRWQGQINQVGKASCQIVALSEVDHAVAGTEFPETLVSKFMTLFFRAPSDSPRSHRRREAAREIFMTCGFNTDVIDATGQSPLAHMLTALNYGDYTAYYLAMCYGVDPTPTPQIDYLHERMAG
jgi:glucose/mannose-6-phosphate isomerase